MKKYTTIFFDLDKTLWDFDTNSSATLLEILDKFSLHSQVFESQVFISNFNRINEHLWDDYRKGKIKKPDLRKERFRRLFSNYGISDPVLLDKISGYYLKVCPSKTALVRNTVETLEYLKPLYKLYVLSNGFYDVQLTKLINSGISRYFIKLFTSDRIGYSKPKAGIFEYAIKSENAKKEECLMVGDDIGNDVRGAMNVHIDQVLYNPEGKVPSVEPTYSITDLIELKEIL
jgi:putative hydrolase of the HAD superfamily